MGVAASVALDASETCVAARIAIGGAAPTPLLVEDAASVLVGSRLEQDVIRAACALVAAAATPIDDVRGSKRFRLHLLAQLTQDVIECAAGRARARIESDAP